MKPPFTEVLTQWITLEKMGLAERLPFGRRIEKRVGKSVTRYLYDREDIVAEYDGANALQAAYIHGPGMDEPLEMKRNGASYFYRRDGLGSVTSLVDGAGNEVRSYRYDSFGNIEEEAGDLPNPYTFTGREHDPETGLLYYRARYYDPQTGRFLSEDPIGFSGGDTNFYAYVGNDPVNWGDPWGLRIVVLGNLSDYQQAIRYLKRTPIMSEIIKNLEDSSTIYKVVLNNAGDDYYIPSRDELFWDPNSALRCTNGTTQSPALGLGHELAHATAPWYWNFIGRKPWGDYDNLEEWRVITGPEKNAAQILGEGIRTDHRGIPYWVPTPISR